MHSPGGMGGRIAASRYQCRVFLGVVWSDSPNLQEGKVKLGRGKSLDRLSVK